MMNSITQNTQTSKETYSVLKFQDLFGSGYLVHAASEVPAAIADGWQVLVENRSREEADKLCLIFKYAGQNTQTPDLSDVLSYDMTEPIEDRDSSVAEEFDLVEILWQGRVIEGVITFFDDETVELDGFTEIPAAYFIDHASLIAKADSDCGFITEYGKELDRINKNWSVVYAVAAKAQNTVEYGEVA